MCVDRHQPLGLVWAEKGGELAEPRADEADRRAVSGNAVLWQPANGATPAQPRLQRGTQARPAANGEDGPTRGLPEATDLRAPPGAPQMALPAARHGDRPAEPGLVRGYYLHSDAEGIPLSRRDHGLGDAPGSLLAAVKHDGCRVLHRGVGGRDAAPRAAEDLQLRSRQPIHQPALHPAFAGCNGEDLDGRPWTLDG